MFPPAWGAELLRAAGHSSSMVYNENSRCASSKKHRRKISGDPSAISQSPCGI
jgi:hypothetical protein